jgi:hypothetical protein
MLKRADQVQGVEYPSSNDVPQLTLCTFVVVPSHKINESNLTEENNDQGVWRKNDNIIFVFIYTISRPLCETSFVFKKFLTFMEKSLKQNVNTWVDSFNFILVLFPFASYVEIYRTKNPKLHLIMKWRLGSFFGFCCNTF